VKHVTWERNELHLRVRCMRRAGCTVDAIAFATGYSPRNVWHIIRREGMPRQEHRPWAEAERERVLEMARRGLSVRCIAHTLLRDYREVRTIIDAAGISRRGPNQRYLTAARSLLHKEREVIVSALRPSPLAG
jgi:hypothetical protein